MSANQQKIIRKYGKLVLYRSAPVRSKGRGAKFQWNSATEYIIVSGDYGQPTKKFKTLAEADKEWTYLILKY